MQGLGTAKPLSLFPLKHPYTLHILLFSTSKKRLFCKMEDCNISKMFHFPFS